MELPGVVPNPHISKVYEGIELCKKEGVDFLLPVGGGSVIDSAKAIAYGLAELVYIALLFCASDNSRCHSIGGAYGKPATSKDNGMAHGAWIPAFRGIHRLPLLRQEHTKGEIYQQA